MADADVEDVCRVLAVCFRSGETLSDLDIERILSFDMGWLSPEEASGSVKALIDSGWLIGDLDSLSSVLTNNSITTPLGWFPRPSRLISPVKYDSVKFEEFNQKDELLSNNSPGDEDLNQPLQQKVSVESTSKDPRSKIERRLKNFVSKQSKLEMEEIERRILRKKNALGMVSNWLCIALIAREQGLEMTSIVEALSIN
ncbi:MAG: DUF2240 family protein [Euryarchaeota archaeon TMED248]|nr:MAG: DUF2240 family protein [Euryarchaeota archaeon TMED248]